VEIKVPMEIKDQLVIKDLVEIKVWMVTKVFQVLLASRVCVVQLVHVEKEDPKDTGVKEVNKENVAAKVQKVPEEHLVQLAYRDPKVYKEIKDA
jgi:hypothetical protein